MQPSSPANQVDLGRAGKTTRVGSPSGHAASRRPAMPGQRPNNNTVFNIKIMVPRAVHRTARSWHGGSIGPGLSSRAMMFDSGAARRSCDAAHASSMARHVAASGKEKIMARRRFCQEKIMVDRVSPARESGSCQECPAVKSYALKLPHIRSRPEPRLCIMEP